MGHIMKLLQMGWKTDSRAKRVRAPIDDGGVQPTAVFSTGQIAGIQNAGGLFLEEHTRFYDDLLRSASDLLSEVKQRGTFNKKIGDAIVERILCIDPDSYHSLLFVLTQRECPDHLASHIIHCAILTIGFCRSAGFAGAELREIGMCALVHDLGMVKYEHLYAQNRRLKEKEYDTIKGHVTQMSSCFHKTFSQQSCDVLLCVHEREQGQGYLAGRTGNEIPAWSKIIMVFDVYDALIHSRSYRSRYSPFEAIKVIVQMKKVMFEQEVVKKFIDYMSIYPVGSLVYLNTSEVAVVTRSNLGDPTRPVVRIVINSSGKLSTTSLEVNLAKSPLLTIMSAVPEDAGLDTGNLFKLDPS